MSRCRRGRFFRYNPRPSDSSSDESDSVSASPKVYNSICDHDTSLKLYVNGYHTPRCHVSHRHVASGNSGEEGSNSDDAREEPQDSQDPADEEPQDFCCLVCTLGESVKGNEILLCDSDGCNGHYHLQCCTPALTKVPFRY